MRSDKKMIFFLFNRQIEQFQYIIFGMNEQKKTHNFKAILIKEKQKKKNY